MLIKELFSPFFNFNLDFYDYFFLFLIAAWILIAVIEDFKKREIEDWWNFSLLSFILVLKLFLSIEFHSFQPILMAGICLLAGIIFSNLFYYARIFAGGDAKLLLALSPGLAFFDSIYSNLIVFFAFLFLMICSGALYSLVYSLILSLKNSKSFSIEFKFISKKYKLLLLISYLILLPICFLFNSSIFPLNLFLLLLPLLSIFLLAVEKSCLKKYVSPKELTLGDWLAEKIKIKNKFISPSWQGLNEKSLSLIQKNYKKKVLVKYGIPFSPAFLLALIILFFLIF